MTAPAPPLDTHPYPLPGDPAVPAPTTLRPCVLCGAPAPTVGFPWDPDYAVCGYPLQYGDGKGLACADRADERDKAAARAREETAPEAPATDGEAPAEAGEPAPVAAKRATRTRPSQVRKAALEKPAPA